MKKSLKELIKLYLGDKPRKSDYGYYDHVELSSNDIILRVDLITGRKDEYYMDDELIKINEPNYVSKSIVINLESGTIHFIEGRWYVTDGIFEVGEFDTVIMEIIKTGASIELNVANNVNYDRVKWR